MDEDFASGGSSWEVEFRGFGVELEKRNEIGWKNTGAAARGQGSSV